MPETVVRVWNRTREAQLAGSARVASTVAERRRGLLGRERLDAGEGLVIPRCEAVHTFFMKFPIDLVYFDGQRRVRKVVRRLKPWRMSACLLARSVLELPAGTVESTGTVAGDQLEITRW